MKIKVQTTTSNTVVGTIHKHELLAFVRQTMTIPEDAGVLFFTRVPTGGSWEGQLIEIGEHTELIFEATWSQENRALPEQDMPARVVTVAEVTKGAPGADGRRSAPMPP